MSVTKRIEKPSPTSSNGGKVQTALQGIIQPRKHLPDSLPWWMVWRIRLTKGWEPVTINKHIDSITMPKWVASAFLVAFLGFAAASWWRQSDQRDMLIELRTELKLAKEYEAERTKQLKEQAEINKVYIDNMTNQLNTIKGMLSAQEMDAMRQMQRKGSNN